MTKIPKFDHTGESYPGAIILKFSHWHLTYKGCSIPKWLCKCKKCNKKFNSFYTSITRGLGCGCRQTTHGMNKTTYHKLWSGIKTRCYNKNTEGYAIYGAKGIIMYEPWLKDFKAFYDWLMDNIGEKPKNYSLDRINTLGNYEPGNLRWASRLTQVLNRTGFNTLGMKKAREIRRLKSKGISQAEISRRLKIKPTLVSRIANNKSYKEAADMGLSEQLTLNL